MASTTSEQKRPKTLTVEPRTRDEDLNALIRKYLQYERIESHRLHVENLVRDNNVAQLQKLIGGRLTFGTAGIRGSMGPGFGQMNDLVIIQTSQGLASYLLALNKKIAREQGVIIGNDARHNSARFARLAALAFLEKKIPVYFCDHIIPTPLIAFGVKHFDCCAGIVVTASHNPKNDNGYKVYWSNGAQILSPHDAKIQEHIVREENQLPWPRAWEHELLRKRRGQQRQRSNSPSSESNSGLEAGVSSGSDSNGGSGNEHQLPGGWEEILFRIHGDLSKNYFSYIERMVGERRERNQSSNICITYTTMHGVGHTFLSRALEIAGFTDTFPVELQKKPDPDFSTVRFPNPEEAGALDLAFETAKHANSNLILANDPDADRCAAALYDPISNYKRQLTGNEIGALLGWWLWQCRTNFKERLNTSSLELTQVDSQSSSEGSVTHKPNELHKDPSDCYMISTAVSSKFLETMAKHEGFHFVETLTGFKYMGNFADELMKQHKKSVVFAYEEAIGYMVDSTILDKDGISAAVQLAQCAAYVQVTYARNLEQHLDWLYTLYGFHFSLNSYYACADQNTIREIFAKLQSNYPADFGREFKVSRVRDLNNNYDSSTPDKKPTLPSSSSSFMVTFFIESANITFTIRTSGTEPKIKYYSEIVAKLPPLSETAIESNNFNDSFQTKAKEETRNKLRRFLDAALERCLRPGYYGLEAAV